MNELKKEWKIIFATLTAVAALSILLAAGFAALYLSGRNALPAGADGTDPMEDPGTLSDTHTDAVTYDTAELVDLRRENEFLEQQAKDLREELDALKQSTAEEETAHIPDPPLDLDSMFDPGDLTPADPESLSYTFDLTEQLAVIDALEQQMEHSPYIVDPDGNLML